VSGTPARTLRRLSRGHETRTPDDAIVALDDDDDDLDGVAGARIAASPTPSPSADAARAPAWDRLRRILLSVPPEASGDDEP
jgi:hypothetical protein